MSANNGKTKQDKAHRLRERLKGRPDDDFKVAVIQAIQKVEAVSHSSREEALAMIGLAVTFHDRNDGVRARLAFYMAGVFVDDRLAHALWNSLVRGPQQSVN